MDGQSLYLPAQSFFSILLFKCRIRRTFSFDGSTNLYIFRKQKNFFLLMVYTIAMEIYRVQHVKFVAI
jgi:hypothetical protein